LTFLAALRRRTNWRSLFNFAFLTLSLISLLTFLAFPLLSLLLFHFLLSLIVSLQELVLPLQFFHRVLRLGRLLIALFIVVALEVFSILVHVVVIIVAKLWLLIDLVIALLDAACSLLDLLLLAYFLFLLFAHLFLLFLFLGWRFGIAVLIKAEVKFKFAVLLALLALLLRRFHFIIVASLFGLFALRGAHDFEGKGIGVLGGERGGEQTCQHE
jgi:hypothetical protein